MYTTSEDYIGGFSARLKKFKERALGKPHSIQRKENRDKTKHKRKLLGSK
jgi:hypothetical protein